MKSGWLPQEGYNRGRVMDRQPLTFLFRVGQIVCWLQPSGPRYVVHARVYVEGVWPAGYTASVPQALDQGPKTLYLLCPDHNILGGFWASEKDLYRCEEGHHAAIRKP